MTIVDVLLMLCDNVLMMLLLNALPFNELKAKYYLLFLEQLYRFPIYEF